MRRGVVNINVSFYYYVAIVSFAAFFLSSSRDFLVLLGLISSAPANKLEAELCTHSENVPLGSFFWTF